MHLFRRGDYSNSQKEPRHNARRQEPHQVSNRTRAQRLRLTGGAQGDHPLDIPVDAALHGYDDARSALDVRTNSVLRIFSSTWKCRGWTVTPTPLRRRARRWHRDRWAQAKGDLNVPAIRPRLCKFLLQIKCVRSRCPWGFECEYRFRLPSRPEYDAQSPRLYSTLPSWQPCRLALRHLL